MWTRFLRIALAGGGALTLPARSVIAQEALSPASQAARQDPEGPDRTGQGTTSGGSPIRVLTLQVLERFAVTRQPQMLVAQAQIGIAEGTVEQARSPFFPQITAIGQYEYGNSIRAFSAANGTTTTTATATATATGTATTNQTSTSPTSSTGTGTVSGFWDFALSGTQLIYDFGQTIGKYRSARDTLDAERIAAKTALEQVLLAVRRAYFTARADKDLVDVARETLRDQQTHLTQVQAMVQVGTQPPIALSQQKAAVANAEVQLITAENNYETAKAQLNQATGFAGGTDYDVGSELIPPLDDEDQPLETLVKKALDARPELATIHKERLAQEATISATKGAYGPALSATGSVAEEGVALDTLQPAWSVGVLVTWPLFQGGLTHGLVHSAEATLSSLDAQQTLEELQVRLDVDSAQLAVRAARATIGSAQDAVTNAHEQLRLAEQRYATGVGSIIELYDAQVAYTSAAAQLVQARYSLATARAQLLAALGRT
jgi:outer membrane protein